MSTEYVSCAETAKLVRASLKRSFPGVKFSVRSRTYSGGASINVSWTDGPARQAVEDVAERYSGSSFDGMIDLKTSSQHWLSESGEVELHRSEIGHSYGETQHREDAPVGARLVHFMADYIFCERDLSETVKSIFRHVAEDRFGPNPKGMAPDWLNVESWRMSHEVSFS